MGLASPSHCLKFNMTRGPLPRPYLSTQRNKESLSVLFSNNGTFAPAAFSLELSSKSSMTRNFPKHSMPTPSESDAGDVDVKKSRSRFVLLPTKYELFLLEFRSVY